MKLTDGDAGEGTATVTNGATPVQVTPAGGTVRRTDDPLPWLDDRPGDPIAVVGALYAAIALILLARQGFLPSRLPTSRSIAPSFQVKSSSKPP